MVKVYQTRARGNFRKKAIPLRWGLGRFLCRGKFRGLYPQDSRTEKQSAVRPPIVNIDQAVVIMSVKEPDFNSNLLDRFWFFWSTRTSIPSSIFPKWICWKIEENWIFTNRLMVTSAMTLDQ